MECVSDEGVLYLQQREDGVGVLVEGGDDGGADLHEHLEALVVGGLFGVVEIDDGAVGFGQGGSSGGE